MVLSTLEAYWQPFVNDLLPTVNYSVFGWLATGYFFSAAIGPALYSVLLSKFNVNSHHAITVILIAVAPLLYYLASSQSIWHFAGLYFAFMAVLACINIPVEVLTNKFTSDNIRSTMQSVMSLVMQAGGALAAFGFAPVIQWLGISSVWRALALLLLIVGFTRLFKAFLPVLSRRFFSPLFKRSIKRT
jgi:Na+/melibiose symporter-like transporter